MNATTRNIIRWSQPDDSIVPPREIAAELIKGRVPARILPFTFPGIRPDFKSMTPKMRKVTAGGKLFGLVFEVSNKPVSTLAGKLDGYWDVYNRSWAFAVADDVKLVGYDTKLEQFYPVGCSPAYGVDPELFSIAHFSTLLNEKFLKELAARTGGSFKVTGFDPPFDADGTLHSNSGDPDQEPNASTQLKLWSNRWNQAALMELDFDTYYVQPNVFPASTDDAFLEQIFDDHRAVAATSRKGWASIIAKCGWVAANCGHECSGLFLATDDHRTLFESMRNWSVQNQLLAYDYIAGSAEPMQRKFFRW